MVERPPPRPILDDFGMDSILGPGGGDAVDPLSVAPGSPPSPSVGVPAIYSPTVYSPTMAEQQGQRQEQGQERGQGQGQGQGPPVSPRPYIPRRSSNSIMGVISSPSGNGNGGSGSGSVASPSSSSAGVAGPSMSSDDSPNLLSQVPMFVKRKRSTELEGFSPSSSSAI